MLRIIILVSVADIAFLGNDQFEWNAVEWADLFLCSLRLPSIVIHASLSRVIVHDFLSDLGFACDCCKQ